MEASRARQTVSQPVSIWRPRIILNLVPIVVRHFYRSPTGQTDIPKLMFVIRERQFIGAGRPNRGIEIALIKFGQQRFFSTF